MTDIRHASLEPGSGERLPGVLAQVGPFFILLLGALWLYRRFGELPARIPIHWNWQGRADGFVSRTPLGVALPLLLGAAICALMVVVQSGLRRSAPRGAMRAPSVKLVVVGEYFTAVLCCGILAASTSGGRLLWPVLVLAFAGILALLIYTAVLARRVPKEPVRNPAAWRGGIFYVDRNDPALFVPKRSGLGYTFNFGHPGAIALTVAILLLPLLALAVAFLAR
jgi:uncharacterized membrane protein